WKARKSVKYGAHVERSKQSESVLDIVLDVADECLPLDSSYMFVVNVSAQSQQNCVHLSHPIYAKSHGMINAVQLSNGSVNELKYWGKMSIKFN
ncbi:MAG: hypothetical protein MK041_13590, partial [Aquabacterium sp.]|nr:hypothetical protein [Aquabacterium sp.]